MSVGNTILEKDAYKFAWVRRIGGSKSLLGFALLREKDRKLFLDVMYSGI